MRNASILLLFFALLPLTGHSQNPRPGTDKKVVVFKFVADSDWFYVPWSGNGTELERLLGYVEEFRAEILSGRMPLYVDGYCASKDTESKNLYLARTRSNRVKSELIVRKGLKEEHFITHNHTKEYQGGKDVVVVTLQLPGKEEIKKEVEEVRVEKEVKQVEKEVEEVKVEKEIKEVKKEVTEEVAVKPAGTTVYLFAIRTNLLYDAFLQPTLGIEWRASRNLGIKVDASYSRWGGNTGKIQKIWHINPELRWYMGAQKRFYMGASANAGKYNTYGYLLGKLWPDDTGYQGKFWNAGLAVGYQLRLSRCFSLDFNLGVGYNSYEYDSFEMIEGTRVYKGRDKSNEFFGPTQGGINLVWTIW